MDINEKINILAGGDLTALLVMSNAELIAACKEILASREELTSLRQYKAEAESQKAIGTCKVWNAGGSGEFRELWGIDDLADGQQVYSRPVPAGSCAVAAFKKIINDTRKNNKFTDYVFGCAMSDGFEKALDLAEENLNSLLSAIPSNSEGEKS